MKKDRITSAQLLTLSKMSSKLYDIANNSSDDTELLFIAAGNIDKFIEMYQTH